MRGARCTRTVAMAVACGAVVLSGCRDQGPESGSLVPVYTLVTIQGATLPHELTDPRSHGDAAIVRGGRIEIHASAVEPGSPEWARAGSLTMHTLAQVVRLRSSGGRDVVAEGEAAVTYTFERDGARLAVFRDGDGNGRTEAPFWLEIRGQSLVMQSEQEALSGWHFAR